VICISIKKILVTGSSGTIGTRLCEFLLSQGYNVSGTDIRPNKWNKTINDITLLADLRNPEDLKRLPKDIDMVIHLAANARVYNLVVEPKLARDNFEMLFNIVEYCRYTSIKNIIFASSREVYGNAGRDIYAEDDSHVKNCESPYTASKISGEALIHAYHQCYGLDFVITRFSNVYGMYDDSDRVIPLFIKHTLKNQDLEVYGKDKFLDFTYIDDTVTGILMCIERFTTIKNNVFNIASGKSVSIIKVAEMIKNSMAGKNKIILKENRTGEVIRSAIDITKAKSHLGYHPTVSIDEGISRSIKWYVQFYS